MTIYPVVYISLGSEIRKIYDSGKYLGLGKLMSTIVLYNCQTVRIYAFVYMRTEHAKKKKKNTKF